MATQDAMQPPGLNPHSSKRKFLNDGNEPTSKKRRAADPQTETQIQTRAASSTSANSGYDRVYRQLLVKLDHKYEVKTMSVMSSTSISKHVDRAIEHLGRFHPWDLTVLPGVVLLCAKSRACSKLITISELIRRRVGESQQKWFQYNVLKEMVVEEAAPTQQEASIVEDTFMRAEGEGEGEDEEAAEDKYFETRQPTIHEQAVQPARVRHKTHLSVLLSRVPLDELKTEPYISVQTNEEHIEHLYKKKMGRVL